MPPLIIKIREITNFSNFFCEVNLLYFSDIFLSILNTKWKLFWQLMTILFDNNDQGQQNCLSSTICPFLSIYLSIYLYPVSPGKKGGVPNDFHIPWGYSPFQIRPIHPVNSLERNLKFWAVTDWNGAFSCLLSLQLVVAPVRDHNGAKFKCLKPWKEENCENNRVNENGRFS